MFEQIMKFMRDEEGATAIEYGLIVGLIAVVLVATLALIGGDSSSGLKGVFTKVQTCLTTPSSCT